MYRSIDCYIYEITICQKKILLRNSLLTCEVTNCIFFSFIPSTDIIRDIFEWLQVHFMSPKFMLISHMYVFVQKCHSTTPWAFPIYARPSIKCANFCPSTQNAMNKVSRWCWWQFSWAFPHKSVMQYTQYMYICVIIITILNVISTTTCVTNCVYLTYHGLHFSNDLWPKLSSLCSFLNLSYNFVCVMSRKFLMWGSRSLKPILNFSTSFWFDEGLLL